MGTALLYTTQYTTPKRYEKTAYIMHAVAAGLRQTGWDTEIRESYFYPQGDEQDANLLVVWGYWPNVRAILRDIGKYPWQLLYVDTGYLRRGHYEGYYSLALNEAQSDGAGTFWQGPCPSTDRWGRLGEHIVPWQKTGRKILILEYSHKQCLRLGLPYPAVNDELHALCRQYTSRPCLGEKKSHRTPFQLRPACQSGEIFAVVARNSKGMVEALLEGVPVFPTQPGICRTRVSDPLSCLDAPTYGPCREEFFIRLAHHQWTLQEIAAGEPPLFTSCHVG